MTRSRGSRVADVSAASRVLVLTALVVSASSCEAVEPMPRTNAPTNTCPCDKYEPGTTAARCSFRRRCEIASGRPEFPFWIVVHVPYTSVSAAGLTYVLFSDAQGNPAFKEAPVEPGVTTRCRPPLGGFCLRIDGVAGTVVRYTVSEAVSRTVGFPLAEQTSIPMRVVYEPTGNGQQAQFPSLPLDVMFGSSRIETTDGRAEAVLRQAIPFGLYRRAFYPQPPFDEFFPPKREEGQEIKDDARYDFILRSVETPTATITREEGLEGWRVWLVDRPSQRRISVIRTLPATAVATDVRLFTTGESLTDGTDRIEAVVAPPESWTAVPRFVTRLFSGAGLEKLDYPRIPPPSTVTGVVAQPAHGGGLLGYAAVVSFESRMLATTADPSPLLSYSTTVNTDDRGRFATVLPPGTYVATIEPAEGTGFAKRKQFVDVDRTVTALTLESSPRTVVKGRAVLTDGRPLGEADVIAIPNVQQSAQPNPLFVAPRPSRTRTGEDGRFAFDLDPGPYVLSVIPKAGTGFPRVVIRPDVPGSLSAQETELADVRIPAPTRLAFTLRDSTPTENAIKNAVVRIFAAPVAPPGATPPDPVEIGSAMTDASGTVEILLAQQPR